MQVRERARERVVSREIQDYSTRWIEPSGRRASSSSRERSR
jgi:hypothetical protein